MNAKHPTQTETHRIEHYEEEIELIDILRVIWKWKYLIIVGTISCGFIAAIISLNMSKIYRIDMTLQPGIVGINESGKKVLIDSVENIETIIQMNVLQNKIVKYLQENDRKNLSNSLRFKVSIPKKTEIIMISYESANTDFGIDVMKSLYQALRENYDELVKYYQDNYDKEIQIIKAEFDILEAESVCFGQGIKSIQKRIKELESFINDIDNENSILIRQRNEIVKKEENGEKSLSAVIYNSTIQQNLSIANQYRNDIKEYLYRIEEEEKQRQERKYRKQGLYRNIKILEYDKGMVQNIQILLPPTPTTFPIKPKTKLNVILALVTGLLIMVFLSFLLEYIKNRKK